MLEVGIVMGVVFIVIGLPTIMVFGYLIYREWLKQRMKGAPPPEKLREIYQQLEIMRKENEKLRKRLENLETIVASVEWDKLLNLAREEIEIAGREREELPPSRRKELEGN
ncbi:MAG: hypothetical protein NZ933_09125 [Bacteroidia bacterium]|nr:hypothetical protein [Bacteroidia bacterium]